MEMCSKDSRGSNFSGIAVAPSSRDRRKLHRQNACATCQRGTERSKFAGIAAFEGSGARTTIQQLWQRMPNTPGKEQEVVRVEANLAASCSPNTALCERFA
jgi:hypothetical protein